MPNVSFTQRLRRAVESIKHDGEKLNLLQCPSGSLYTPVYRGGKYRWAKVMDADGLLVTERQIHPGEGAASRSEARLVLGAIIQSEDATSQTKPNPLGKAAVGHLPYGIWVNANNGRRRLDRVQIVFVIPRGTAANRLKRFQTARRNVENAADMMPDTITVPIARGISEHDLREELLKVVRPFLRGRGRPRGS